MLMILRIPFPLQKFVCKFIVALQIANFKCQLSEVNK